MKINIQLSCRFLSIFFPPRNGTVIYQIVVQVSQMPSQTRSFINKTNNSDTAYTSVSIYYGFSNNKNDFELQKKKKYTSSLKFNETLLLVSLYLFFLDAENSGDCPDLLLTLVANILTSLPSQNFSEQPVGHSSHPVPRPLAHSRTKGLENPREKALIRLTLHSLPRGPLSG